MSPVPPRPPMPEPERSLQLLHASGVSKHERLASAVGLPYAHRPVCRSGDDPLAVGAPGRRTDAIVVASEHEGLA